MTPRAAQFPSLSISQLGFNTTTVRAAYASTGSSRAAARLLGISKSSVNNIVTGKYHTLHYSTADKMTARLPSASPAALQKLATTEAYLKSLPTALRSAEIQRLAKGEAPAQKRFEKFRERTEQKEKQFEGPPTPDESPFAEEQDEINEEVLDAFAQNWFD